uniref:glycerol kinase n=1 Tax=Globodera pallida TaxID=36090 RepID=A0A183BJ21_GLOPA
MDKPPLLLALDVGTTNLKVCLFDASPSAGCALIHGHEEAIQLLCSSDGQRMEMEPEQLWTQIVHGMRRAVADTETKGSLVGIGLSCQRNTFLSWNRQNFRPCHRLITWKDGRARHFCNQWNGSMRRKLLNMAGAVAYFFTRDQHYRAARMFRLVSAMVPPRFLAMLEESAEMRGLLAAGQLAIGCLDTWLMLKLSGREGWKQHLQQQQCFITEPSSASSTGMFDPFTSDWGRPILRLLGFPNPCAVLPALAETTRLGLHTDPELFGRAIPINASLGDSQAAAFGAGCIRRGDLKISLGTGTLLDYVSGPDIHSSMKGMYPLVAWRLDGRSTHLLEGRSNDVASAIHWAQSIGLMPAHDAAAPEGDLDGATDDDDDGSLCFVPAFGGLQTPVGDDFACAALMGIRSITTRRHIVHAVLDSVAFSVYQIWLCLVEEVPTARNGCCRIRCCGGVSRNARICERIATLIGRPVERAREPQFCSARGAALLAGIGAGLWTLDQVDSTAGDQSLVHVERVFHPQTGAAAAALQLRFRRWREAQRRCLHYYEHK